MKRYLYYVLSAIVAVFLLFPLVVRAEDSGIAYTVKSEGERFALYFGEERRAVGEIDEILELTEGGAVYLDNLFVNGDIRLGIGEYHLSGIIKLNGAIFIEEGVTAFVKDLNLYARDGLIINGGSLTVESGEISSDNLAVRMDRSALSAFYLKGGIVRSTAAECIRINRGVATISGGLISSPNGIGIRNLDTLYFGGGVSVNAVSYGIVSDSAIFLTADGMPFGGEVKVKILESYEKGELSIAFMTAAPGQVEAVRLYDASGEEVETKFFKSYSGVAEENFIAAYDPYVLSYSFEQRIIGEELLLKGEAASGEIEVTKEGYKHTGWYCDPLCRVPFDVTRGLSEDTTVYAGLELLPPTFTISNYKGVYDGKEKLIGFKELRHPEDKKGVYSFAWLNAAGERVSSAEALTVKNVKDSGLYRCVITLNVGEYSASVTTPPVSIEIEKKEVEIPNLMPKEYCGRVMYADIPRSILYSYEECGYKDAGEYKIPLTLTDKDNYRWQHTEGDTYEVSFVILKASNTFVDKLCVNDIYFGAELICSVSSAFGEPTVMFAEDPRGEYKKEPPIKVGSYYAKAVVEGSDNYHALEGEIVEFKILPELAIALTVNTQPLKTVYNAFELFDRTGLSITVSYNSGRQEVIDGSLCSIAYQSRDGLICRQNKVKAEYLGLAVYIEVEVLPIAYEGYWTARDTECIYSGKYNTLTAPDTLTVGKDGYPLKISVKGGGEDVGVYPITVKYSTDSENYSVPDEQTVYMTVLPQGVTVHWSGLSFVYDGSLKAPKAVFTDAFGAIISLAVNGGGVNAGEYSALAVCEDNNYLLKNDTAGFSIEKAEYDLSGVSWLQSSVVYDGKEKSVSLIGLPSGVSVVGYVGNTATEAGEYFASVSLLYDELNYNEPIIPPYKWRIEKAEYRLQASLFVGGEVEYNRKLQYPTLRADMPVGFDGIRLDYSFDRGVKDVAEGVVTVTVSFSTKSDNYRTPLPITVEMWVKPKPIEVLWGNLSFVYNKSLIVPTANSEYCDIIVEGGAFDAGEYIATACSTDPNYEVTNKTASFVIEKKRNTWLKYPSIKEAYAGGTPTVDGKCEHGEIYVDYYYDKECKNKAELPLAVGKYYAVFYVNPSQNYLPLASPSIEFSVVKVAPETLEVIIINKTLVAFDVLCQSDYSAKIINNDGSVYKPDAVVVAYPVGNSLRAGEQRLVFTADGLSAEIVIKVEKKELDLSGAYWCYDSSEYSGEEKRAWLTGLPDGVTVKEYKGPRAVDVGEYTKEAVLDYDRDNYHEPEKIIGIIKVTPCMISPQSELIEYDGKAHTPSVDESLFKPVSLSFTETGRYRIKLELLDPYNYCLEDGEYLFELSPRKITIKVNDVEKYLFEKPSGFGAEITEGELVEGDELGLVFFVNDGIITADASNRNYKISVESGNYISHPYPTREATTVIFFTLLSFITLFLIVLVIVFKRDTIAAVAGAMAYRIKSSSSRRSALVDDMEERLLSVDAVKAEEMLSDPVARSLLKKRERVATAGRRRAIINIDTLSSNFTSGERIDINRMKEKGLIPADTGYIKVLARGVVDKPLIVVANDFSITAVKMIALTGGEAIKAGTRRHS